MSHRPNGDKPNTCCRFCAALPLDDNILEWHYMILGPKGSPYEGGCYHGKVRGDTHMHGHQIS